MNANQSHRSKIALTLLIAGLIPTIAMSEITFDFESVDQFNGNTAVSGDINLWEESTDVALTGSSSLRFTGAQPVPFRSFTYDLPIDIEEGTVSVWFYDTVGQGTGSFTWGGSIILEDANNPGDFVALEINDLPYAGAPGSLPYHASEGVVDRGLSADKYDSDSLAIRSVGWHQVVFTIAGGETSISVDGSPVADEVAGPGSLGTDLRLRFMADSASAGGFGNWTTATEGYPAPANLVYFDDVTFSATAPSADTASLDFEDDNGSGDPEYDTLEEFMVSSAYNEPNMQGFVHNFAPTTAFAHSGANSVSFTGEVAPLRNIVIDLSSASPGTITIPFYDTLGQDDALDKLGAAFIIEDGNNPEKFIAAEIWNAPYPYAAAQKNYYLTTRPAAFSSGFHSAYFGARSIGWQTLEIELTNTYSRMTINGIGSDGANASAIYNGPGLDSNPKLRIMADSPTLGGFLNWQDSSTWTDPDTPELDILDLEKNPDYVYLDDIQLPLPPSSGVADWMSFE